MNQTRMRERRFVYIQCKVLAGLESSEISRRRWHRLAAPLVPRCLPPSLRPRTRRTSCVSSARGRDAGTAKETDKEVD